MKVFQEYLDNISNNDQQETVTDILNWVSQTYPKLVPVIKWNQPMFTDHGTYIIGFSISKKHLAVSPEVATMKKFAAEIEHANYDHTENIIRIKWEQAINYDLLAQMIDFNISDKSDYQNFWR